MTCFLQKHDTTGHGFRGPPPSKRATCIILFHQHHHDNENTVLTLGSCLFCKLVLLVFLQILQSLPSFSASGLNFSALILHFCFFFSIWSFRFLVLHICPLCFIFCPAIPLPLFFSCSFSSSSRLCHCLPEFLSWTSFFPWQTRTGPCFVTSFGSLKTNAKHEARQQKKLKTHRHN